MIARAWTRVTYVGRRGPRGPWPFLSGGTGVMFDRVAVLLARYAFLLPISVGTGSRVFR
jgi:hypothetical protein